MISTVKELFIRFIKFSLYMGGINFILGYIKPYLEVIIYHIIVGPKIYIGAFFASSTLTFLSYVIGLSLLWQFLKLIRKFL